jgi:hypothetical protein
MLRKVPVDYILQYTMRICLNIDIALLIWAGGHHPLNDMFTLKLAKDKNGKLIQRETRLRSLLPANPGLLALLETYDNRWARAQRRP